MPLSVKIVNKLSSLSPAAMNEVWTDRHRLIVDPMRMHPSRYIEFFEKAETLTAVRDAMRRNGKSSHRQQDDKPRWTKPSSPAAGTPKLPQNIAEMICRRCGGKGHLFAQCPTAQSTASAPAGGRGEGGGGGGNGGKWQSPKRDHQGGNQGGNNGKRHESSSSSSGQQRKSNQGSSGGRKQGGNAGGSAAQSASAWNRGKN